MGAAYAVRMVLIRHDGLDAAGLYQSAWAIGGLYVGFVLQAMGADFYPRLVAVAKDNAECNRLVNEQAQVSLLLAGCGVIATLTFAPWSIELLYSSDFEACTDVLRWIMPGHGDARDHLAGGLHTGGQGRTDSFRRHRPGVGGGKSSA